MKKRPRRQMLGWSEFDPDVLGDLQEWTVAPTPVYPVRVRFGESRDGRLICTGLLIGAYLPLPEVTAKSLREIPVGAILEAARADYYKEGVGRQLIEASMADPEWPLAAPRSTPRSVTTDHLERLAAAYKAALRSHGRKAVAHLEQTLSMERSTIYRHLARCRKEGISLVPEPIKRRKS